MEITSFNALFSDATNHGIKLEAFRQDDAGFFYACWRRDGVLGPELKRRLPFNAALDAYLACRDAPAEADADRSESDLFG